MPLRPNSDSGSDSSDSPVGPASCDSLVHPTNVMHSRSRCRHLAHHGALLTETDGAILLQCRKSETLFSKEIFCLVEHILRKCPRAAESFQVRCRHGVCGAALYPSGFFHQTAERSRASRHYSYTFGLAYPLSLLLLPVERDVVPSPDTGRAGTQLCESTLALPNLYSCRQTTCAGGGGALFFSQPKRQNKHMVVEHPDTFLCLPIAVPGCHLHRWLTDDEQLCRNWLRASNAS